MTFRVGFVTGATPDKWARTWRERDRENLELVPMSQEDQERVLRAGEVDMALVRLPLDRDGLHLITLYDEQPVVVAGRDHFVAAADEVDLADLTEEQLVRPHPVWAPSAPQKDWPPMTEKDAVETVAAGAGIVILPASVARLFHRKDVVVRPVPELPATTIGLAWLVERDDDRCQRFVGIVRGRRVNSSR